MIISSSALPSSTSPTHQSRGAPARESDGPWPNSKARSHASCGPRRTVGTQTARTANHDGQITTTQTPDDTAAQRHRRSQKQRKHGAGRRTSPGTEGSAATRADPPSRLSDESPHSKARIAAAVVQKIAPREIDGVHAPDGDARTFGALRKRIQPQRHRVLLRCPRRYRCRCRRDADLDRPLQPTVKCAMSTMDSSRRRSPARSGWATWKPPGSTSRERPEDSSPESNDTASRDRAAHEESTWSDPPPSSSHAAAAVMSRRPDRTAQRSASRSAMSSVERSVPSRRR